MDDFDRLRMRLVTTELERNAWRNEALRSRQLIQIVPKLRSYIAALQRWGQRGWDRKL